MGQIELKDPVLKTGCHNKKQYFHFFLPPLSQIDFNLKALEIFFLNFKSQKLFYHYNFPPRRIIVDHEKKIIFISYLNHKKLSFDTPHDYITQAISKQNVYKYTYIL